MSEDIEDILGYIGNTMYQLHCAMAYYNIPVARSLSDSIYPIMHDERIPADIRADYFCKRADIEWRMQKMEWAIASMSYAYSLAEDAHNKGVYACNLADFYFKVGKISESIAYCDKALMSTDEVDVQIRAKHFKGRAICFSGNVSDLNESIRILNEAAEEAEKGMFYTELALIIMDLSNVFVKMGMIDTAITELYRAEGYMRKNNNLDLYTRLCVKRAQLLYEQGCDEEAKKLILDLGKQNN